MEKKVKDLVIGEKLKLENSEIRKISDIGYGFYHKSRLIKFSNAKNDWICLYDSEVVNVED